MQDVPATLGLRPGFRMEVEWKIPGNNTDVRFPPTCGGRGDHTGRRVTNSLHQRVGLPTWLCRRPGLLHPQYRPATLGPRLEGKCDSERRQLYKIT